MDFSEFYLSFPPAIPRAVYLFTIQEDELYKKVNSLSSARVEFSSIQNKFIFKEFKL